jgi:molecular chaperone DnaK
VPVHEKARAEMLIADARQAVKDEAPLDRLRSLTGELQQIFHGMAAGPTGGGGPAPGGGPSASSGGPGDDVIDAEVVNE